MLHNYWFKFSTDDFKTIQHKQFFTENYAQAQNEAWDYFEALSEYDNKQYVFDDEWKPGLTWLFTL
jgi:hypothetical protein